MKIFGICLVVCFVFDLAKPNVAFAQPEDIRVTQFRYVALNTLLAADSECLANIPYVSIERIRAAALSANVSIARIEAGGRTSGLWTKNLVSFDPDSFAAAPKLHQAILSLHEFIGQSHNGYVDDGYSFSTAITLCSQLHAIRFVTRLKWPKAYLEKSFILEARAGGSTAVGGGGDYRDIQIKMEAIEILLKIAESGQNEFLNQPIVNIFSGLLFVNIYRSKEAAKDNFNIYIPTERDRHIKSVVLVNPETFDSLYALPSNQRIVQMFQLAILFSNRVLEEY